MHRSASPKLIHTSEPYVFFSLKGSRQVLPPVGDIDATGRTGDDSACSRRPAGIFVSRRSVRLAPTPKEAPTSRVYYVTLLATLVVALLASQSIAGAQRRPRSRLVCSWIRRPKRSLMPKPVCSRPASPP